MSAESNKAVIQRLWWNEPTAVDIELRLMDEFFTDDFVRYFPGGKMDRAEFKKRVAMMIKAFPDSRHKIEGLISEGDWSAFHYVLTGTDKGGYRGNAPTGNSFAQTQANFCRFRGGKIVELRVFPVPPSIDEQLGVGPAAR